MIESPRQLIPIHAAEWHPGFIRLLPRIERYARKAFRSFVGESKDDAVCEVIANCLCAYRRLFDRNELHRAFASALVRYAVAQFFSGRRVGTAQCSRDVYSARIRRTTGRDLVSFGTAEGEGGQWLDSVVDHRTAVPDQVNFRIEFPRWLVAQTNRNRQIAQMLSLGYTTQEVSIRFEISAARVSQIRRELCNSWNKFIRDIPRIGCDDSPKLLKGRCSSVLHGFGN